MSTAVGIAYVVDDEVTIREGLDSLLRSVGYKVHGFATAADFLAFDRPLSPSCLLLDIRMPGTSGMELQAMLRDQGQDIPIVFLTGHGDVPLSVRAMKLGAVDFLQKPFHEQSLLDAVRIGIERDRQRLLKSLGTSDFQSLFQTLSRREAEVIHFVNDGLANREIASRLGLAEITIKVARGAAMRKLNCRSVVELIHKMNRTPS